MTLTQVCCQIEIWWCQVCMQVSYGEIWHRSDVIVWNASCSRLGTTHNRLVESFLRRYACRCLWFLASWLATPCWMSSERFCALGLYQTTHMLWKCLLTYNSHAQILMIYSILLHSSHLNFGCNIKIIIMFLDIR